MAMLTDIRVPLPQECETQLECHRHLGEISDRLASNLRARLGGDFEVLTDVRAISFGGQWTRETRVYQAGELRATFAVAFDFVISPHDFEVNRLLPTPATAVPKLAAIAASAAATLGGAALGGPLAGALAGASTLLATTVATIPWTLGRSKAPNEADPLFSLEGARGLEPLLN